jgi:hypothetical protein
VLQRICLTSAFIIGVFLVWAASQPAVGKIAAPHWHYAAHFAAFALLAAMSALGMPRVPLLALTASIVLFGFLHELYEIVGHAHGFELRDAVVDGIGAVAGAHAARWLRRRLLFRRNHT